jgi:Flp pilus assembly protein CpaB
MKMRGLSVAVALVLAVGATLGVFLYVQGVKKEAKTPTANAVSVVVSKKDIPAGTKLDALITAGDFTTLSVSKDALVQGAVTSLSQLQGRTTNAFVLHGEQISTVRLQGTNTRTGGTLGLSEGYQAITIALDTPRAGGGIVAADDHITIYATLDSVSIIRGNLQAFLKGKQVDNTKQDIGDFTIVVVPDVRVLRVSSTGTGVAAPTKGDIQLTLELLPEDTQKLVFAQEHGKIWLSLLAPGEKGFDAPPLQVGDLLLTSVGAGPV